MKCTNIGENFGNVARLFCDRCREIWIENYIIVRQYRSKNGTFIRNDISTGADPETLLTGGGAQLWSNIFINRWNQLKPPKPPLESANVLSLGNQIFQKMS